MTEHQVRMPTEYDEAYSSLMHEISSSSYLFPSGEPLTCSWTEAGPAYRPGKHWLFVGQAPNGWGEKSDNVWIWPKKPPSIAKVRSYGDELDDGTDNLLQWVEDRGEVRRGFWSVVRWLASDDDESWEKSWSRKVAWTNLYKIAPASGGNPSDDLCDAQFEACRELLGIETETYDPSVVVFLSGMDWARRFARNGFEATPEDKTRVVAGKFLGRLAVVAPHPHGAQYRGLGSNTLAENILAEIKRAGWDESTWE